MSWDYDPKRDMLTGHDYPGVCGAGMAEYQLAELELGARAAAAAGDPDQWWWALREDTSADAEVKR